MNPYYSDESVTVYHGDCLDVLATLPDASVDSVVTDPPYGLEFMGKDWDQFKPSDALIRTRTRDIEGRAVSSAPDAYRAGAPFQLWCQQWATECLRVLKPGGHMLAFGGTRTWHRLAAAIEDAGFEIRDSIAWLYGSGFPKSLDVSKAIDKVAGVEREVVGAAPNSANRSAVSFQTRDKPTGYTAYAEGPRMITAPATAGAKQWQGWGTALKPAFEPIVVARKPLRGTVAACVTEHGTGALNIDACRVGTDERTYRARGMKSLVDQHSVSDRPYTAGLPTRDEPEMTVTGRWPTNVVIDEHTAEGIDQDSGALRARGNIAPTNGGGGMYGHGIATVDHGAGDEGGASRFFPTFRYNAKAPGTERPAADGTSHPTVKPLDLMRWLVRLVTPPHGLILDPFAGSGTTAEACIHEHMRCITIERESSYLPLIVARLRKPMAVGFDFEEGA